MTMADEIEVPLLRRLVGQALRRRWLAQGRTLRDVADAARVSMPYLSEVERGLKEASSEVLAAICRALRLRLADLLDEVRAELARVEPEIAPVTSVRPLPVPGAQATPTIEARIAFGFQARAAATIEPGLLTPLPAGLVPAPARPRPAPVSLVRAPIGPSRVVVGTTRPEGAVRGLRVLNRPGVHGVARPGLWSRRPGPLATRARFASRPRVQPHLVRLDAADGPGQPAGQPAIVAGHRVSA